MEYVRRRLLNPKSNYEESVLRTIRDLYYDLEKRRQPIVVDNSSKISIVVYPVSFGIPEENIVHTVPPKLKDFGRVIPGIRSTYFSLKDENKYYEDMADSLFAITYKKSGWDCLRHLGKTKYQIYLFLSSDKTN